MCATSATARANASALACDGLVNPVILRTYWSAAASTSASVAGGAKLWRVRMLRHMWQLPSALRRTLSRDRDRVIPSGGPPRSQANSVGS